MTNVTHYSQHIGVNPEKFYKTTLFQAEHLLIGLNCLEPGQTQKIHAHSNQDKFYLVMEGSGRFTIGEEVSEVGPGYVLWAEAGVPHGVTNAGSERLVIFMGIAPAPK